MSDIQVIIQFPDQESAAAWFREARSIGLIPGEAGLRHADALDLGGRARRGQLIVSADISRNQVVEPRAEKPQ